MGAASSVPLVLAITTSDAACAAAIHDNSGERGAEGIDLGRGHAERVVDVCEGALRAAKASWGELSHVAVDVGPGSFTGVRAGVAAARGLALSLDVPALGIDAFEAIAAKVPDRPLVVAMDLRRGRFAIRRFERAGGAPLRGTADEIAGSLGPEAFHLRGTAAGDATLRAALDRAGLPPISAEAGAPTASGLARAALHVIASGAPLPPPVPLYLRGADAAPAAPSPFADPSVERTAPC